MDESKLKVVYAKIEPELRLLLERVRKKDGRTISGVVAQMIREYAARHYPEFVATKK